MTIDYEKLGKEIPTYSGYDSALWPLDWTKAARAVIEASGLLERVRQLEGYLGRLTKHLSEQKESGTTTSDWLTDEDRAVEQAEIESAKLRGRVKELEDALEEYGEHTYDCFSEATGNGCICGLDKAKGNA